ncbi:MAG: peptidase, partial [Casimicrobium sp.]
MLLTSALTLTYAHAGGATQGAVSKASVASSGNDRMIVKLKNAPSNGVSAQAAGGVSAMAVAAASIASTRLGRQVTPFLDIGGGAVVLKLDRKLDESALRQAAIAIAQDPSVAYAEPDRRLKRMLVPNDTRYALDQKNMQARSAANQWGINAPIAWDSTTGNASVVIAVIDTGIVTHADLNANVLPGYDMISDVDVANDGDGRDVNPADPGDWITSTEAEAPAGPFFGCDVDNSSWHGSHV